MIKEKKKRYFMVVRNVSSTHTRVRAPGKEKKMIIVIVRTSWRSIQHRKTNSQRFLFLFSKDDAHRPSHIFICESQQYEREKANERKRRKTTIMTYNEIYSQKRRRRKGKQEFFFCSLSLSLSHFSLFLFHIDSIINDAVVVNTQVSLSIFDLMSLLFDWNLLNKWLSTSTIESQCWTRSHVILSLRWRQTRAGKDRSSFFFVRCLFTNQQTFFDLSEMYLYYNRIRLFSFNNQVACRCPWWV